MDMEPPVILSKDAPPNGPVECSESIPSPLDKFEPLHKLLEEALLKEENHWRRDLGESQINLAKLYSSAFLMRQCALMTARLSCQIEPIPYSPWEDNLDQARRMLLPELGGIDANINPVSSDSPLDQMLYFLSQIDLMKPSSDDCVNDPDPDDLFHRLNKAAAKKKRKDDRKIRQLQKKIDDTHRRKGFLRQELVNLGYNQRSNDISADPSSDMIHLQSNEMDWNDFEARKDRYQNVLAKLEYFTKRQFEGSLESPESCNIHYLDPHVTTTEDRLLSFIERMISIFEPRLPPCLSSETRLPTYSGFAQDQSTERDSTRLNVNSSPACGESTRQSNRQTDPSVSRTIPTTPQGCLPPRPPQLSHNRRSQQSPDESERLLFSSSAFSPTSLVLGTWSPQPPAVRSKVLPIVVEEKTPKIYRQSTAKQKVTFAQQSKSLQPGSPQPSPSQPLSPTSCRRIASPIVRGTPWSSPSPRLSDNRGDSSESTSDSTNSNSWVDVSKSFSNESETALKHLAVNDVYRTIASATKAAILLDLTDSNHRDQTGINNNNQTIQED
eukprot:GHVH01005466.1.p1 GENE.GHVH01005466.1~~GHVH01005466.1.p1  ORF type:complete len:554 (-),score=78.70 GHVH01005466.1:701-2362(-)